MKSGQMDRMLTGLTRWCSGAREGLTEFDDGLAIPKNFGLVLLEQAVMVMEDTHQHRNIKHNDEEEGRTMPPPHH